jgi:hypothetical protein
MSVGRSWDSRRSTQADHASPFFGAKRKPHK